VRSTKNGGYSSKHICVFEQNKNLHCCSFVDCLRLKTRTSQSCKVYVEQALYCNHWSISHFQLMWLRAVNTFCYCHQLVASAYTSSCCSVPLPIRIAGGRKAQSPQSCGGTKALSPRSWGGTKAQRSPQSCGGRKAQSPQSCWRSRCSAQEGAANPFEDMPRPQQGKRYTISTTGKCWYLDNY